MTSKKKEIFPYSFEQGPIRPPAEANSLLLRLTRNCPWNRCTFCPLYKNEQFSIRSVEHVIRDIDTAYKYITAVKNERADNSRLTQNMIDKVAQGVQPAELPVFNAALHWYAAGMKSIFLQDANSLIVKPVDLIAILCHIKECFPEVERVTSFGRSRTILKISDENLKKYAELGLNRIHAGLETGSDKILALTQKGCTKEMHIQAGLQVQKAGIELSECVLLGLGGKNLSEEHAVETADVINQINPPIIRFLTLAPPRGAEIFVGNDTEEYLPSTDLDIAKEIKLFIEHLKDITSYIESNNIVNLLQEIKGVLPVAKEKMLKILNSFINLPDEQRMVYQVGKRLQHFSGLSDLNDTARFNIVKETCLTNGINRDNVDSVIRSVIQDYLS